MSRNWSKQSFAFSERQMCAKWDTQTHANIDIVQLSKVESFRSSKKKNWSAAKGILKRKRRGRVKRFTKMLWIKNVVNKTGEHCKEPTVITWATILTVGSKEFAIFCSLHFDEAVSFSITLRLLAVSTNNNSYSNLQKNSRTKIRSNFVAN